MCLGLKRNRNYPSFSSLFASVECYASGYVIHKPIFQCPSVVLCSKQAGIKDLKQKRVIIVLRIKSLCSFQAKFYFNTQKKVCGTESRLNSNLDRSARKIHTKKQDKNETLRIPNRNLLYISERKIQKTEIEKEK